MRKLLVLAPFAILSFPAFAADAVMDVEPQPPMAEIVPVGDWTGFYAGVQIGGAFGGDSGVINLSPFTPGLQTAFAPGFSGDFDNGVIGGVHVGYDWQFGQIVVGGILDLTGTDIGDVQQGRSITPATYTIERDLDYLATLRARIGYTVTPSILAYATGGIAYGKVDFSYSQPGSGAAFNTSGGQDNDIGYTVGAGVEAKVTQKISLGLEYLYTNLGGNDFRANLVNGPFGGPTGAPGSNPAGTTLTGSDGDFDFHTVQLKLSYRF